MIRISATVLALTFCLVGCDAEGKPSAGKSDPTASVGTPTPTTIDEPQTQVSLKEARRRWDDAMIASILEGTGRYRWTSHFRGFADPFMEESGVFGFDPMRTSFTRVITNLEPGPGDRTEFVVRMIRRDHQTYMQMEDWGRWEGCWLRLGADGLGDEVSADQRAILAQLEQSPEIPTPIAVPLNSTVSKTSADHFPSPYIEYTSVVSLYEALAFLGLNGRILQAERSALLEAKAPITVAIGVDDRPYGAAASGEEIAAALDRSTIDLGGSEIRDFIGMMSSELTFSDLGSDAAVQRPRGDDILPPNATQQTTCAAQR